MTAVVRVEWELRVRGEGKVALAAMRHTSAGDVAEVVLDGTTEHLRASLYSALALLGDDGSQGRPPANTEELQQIAFGAGVGGGERRALCSFCSSGVPGSHTAACARPR